MFIETENSLNECSSPSLHMDRVVESKIQMSSSFHRCLCIRSDLGLAAGVVTQNSVKVDPLTNYPNPYCKDYIELILSPIPPHVL
jgi:hypothetical protein